MDHLRGRGGGRGAQREGMVSQKYEDLKVRMRILRYGITEPEQSDKDMSASYDAKRKRMLTHELS